MAQNLSTQFQLAAYSATVAAERRVPEISLTERQRREREYYEQYSRMNVPSDISFELISGNEHRPWNPYWFLCESVAARFRSEDQKLLDFGCGPGIYSVIFAKVGFQVFGLDLSPS